MGAVLSVVTQLTTIPAVAQLLQKLTGKLLGNQGVEAKVTAAVSPVVIVQVIKFVLSALGYAELAQLVEAQEANLFGAYVAVGAFVAYFTKNVPA